MKGEGVRRCCICSNHSPIPPCPVLRYDHIDAHPSYRKSNATLAQRPPTTNENNTPRLQGCTSCWREHFTRRTRVHVVRRRRDVDARGVACRGSLCYVGAVSGAQRRCAQCPVPGCNGQPCYRHLTRSRGRTTRQVAAWLVPHTSGLPESASAMGALRERRTASVGSVVIAHCYDGRHGPLDRRSHRAPAIYPLSSSFQRRQPRCERCYRIAASMLLQARRLRKHGLCATLFGSLVRSRCSAAV